MTRYFFLYVVFCILLGFPSAVKCGNPKKAYYSKDNSHLFWFVLISDTHIGNPCTTEDDEHLSQFLSSIYVINPKFIINLGDLTDHYMCSLPTGNPQACNHLKEWEEYRKIVVNQAGMYFGIYFDVPGNHDQYWEQKPLSHYLEYSLQGRATHQTQYSWVYTTDFGKYHFITIATPHPDYTNPILDGVSGCPGELSDEELDFIEEELQRHKDANLTFIFGHHPIENLGGPFGQGQLRFVTLLDKYKVSIYAYGHTHISSAHMVNNTLRLNVDSLWEHSQYTIVAVDNDGVSVTRAHINQWPVVLITAPIDKNLGGKNPYAYSIPAAKTNPIRALVFDKNPIIRVQYRIDGGKWHSMLRVNSYLWETTNWDCSKLRLGEHEIEVQAIGSSIASDKIVVEVVFPQLYLEKIQELILNLWKAFLGNHKIQD